MKYSHKFKEAFEYEGKKYETLDFDFDKLTGKDVLNIEADLSDAVRNSLDFEMSKEFQLKMAARAANVGADVLAALPIREFTIITNRARNFLLTGSVK